MGNDISGYRRPPVLNQPRPQGLKGVLFWNKGPAPPWGKAIVAAISIGIPFMFGSLFHHMDWALLASMGGFTALYVHNETYAHRAIKLFYVIIGLVLSFGLGMISSASSLGMVISLTIVSAVSTFISRAFKLPPPGGYFFVLVCCVGTIIPFDLSLIPFRMGVAFLGGCITWLVCMAGWLWRPYNQENAAVMKVYQHLGSYLASIGKKSSDLEKHQLVMALKSAEDALSTSPFSRKKIKNQELYLINLIEKANDLFLAAIEVEAIINKPINEALSASAFELAKGLKDSQDVLVQLKNIGLQIPAENHLKEELLKAASILNGKTPIEQDYIQYSKRSLSQILRGALSPSSGVVTASLRIGIAVFVASLLAVIFRNERPYWVSLACASALQGATSWAVVQRTFQRSIGTAFGVLIGGLILAFHASSWKLVLIVMVLQLVIELLIVRNYIVAVTIITPLALIITHFSGLQLPIPQLVGARLIDTLLGSAVALLAGMFLWHKSASSSFPDVLRTSIQVSGDLLLEVLREDGRNENEIVLKRKKLMALLINLRLTYDGALNEVRRDRVIDSYWPAIIAMQRLGYLISAASKSPKKVPNNQLLTAQLQSIFLDLYKGTERSINVPQLEAYPGIGEEIKELYESLRVIQLN